MMESLKILGENREFLTSAYGINGITGLLIVAAIVDVIFRGWAMWRAARMEKKSWFIALLIINSMAILPIIFLLMTNSEYEMFRSKKK